MTFSESRTMAQIPMFVEFLEFRTDTEKGREAIFIRPEEIIAVQKRNAAVTALIFKDGRTVTLLENAVDVVKRLCGLDAPTAAPSEPEEPTEPVPPASTPT